ncbi:hypothetical protein Y032_0322g2462 [Ancylostoma ceylanicum]|uniref:Uncharacterized protein n=1 Tax=Ancylostoma ceylanicum TaxID=53326 RepID=A0A016S1Q4_9BILA|nr:hypothetical protein Y032_0322g2462 [Ancylostoma ceylanicum]
MWTIAPSVAVTGNDVYKLCLYLAATRPSQQKLNDSPGDIRSDPTQDSYMRVKVTQMAYFPYNSHLIGFASQIRELV